MKEFGFRVENQPGALEAVASRLGEVGININGISGIGISDDGVIRLVTDDPDKTRGVLQDLGLSFDEKEALLIDVPNRPGELAAILRRLGDEHLNVESAYAGVEKETLILTVDDTVRAKQVLAVA